MLPGMMGRGGKIETQREKEDKRNTTAIKMAPLRAGVLTIGEGGELFPFPSEFWAVSFRGVVFFLGRNFPVLSLARRW